MKLGKLVAKGVAEDVLDVAVEEPRPAHEPGTTEADTALPLTALPLTAESMTAESVTAGSSTER